MPARRGEAWNDEDYADLRAMARGGQALTAIARRLERTPESVLAKAKRMRLGARLMCNRYRMTAKEAAFVNRPYASPSDQTGIGGKHHLA